MNVIIHGHFYQPPREDPISNYIPDETGAQPYHNWNERILHECYAPNAYEGNFERISFNLGPTLFRWLAEAAPEVSRKIIEQERRNYDRFGYGNGMAQAYNHVILPLASYQDKVTQIRWGIADFEFRFGHKPEGLWLPETAADLETLQVASDQGIRFTILAPWQLQNQSAEPGPYLINLGGDRPPFSVFVYDRELSTEVSFNPAITRNGDNFLEEINRTRNHKAEALTVIASDGELYGHHRRFRDKFLTYVLNQGGSQFSTDWTFPGRWMREHPITQSAALVERTSWSCHHGITRWEGECDCTPGADWKQPLREALNQIAEWVDQAYLDVTAPHFADPWELRNRYVDVINQKQTLQDLCAELSPSGLTPESLKRTDLLLRAQYERQRMFTSCGFFFDEFHRIEPQNNVAYAANAVWLTKSATGLDLQPAVIDSLARVQSKKTGLRADTIFSQTLLRASREERL